MKKKDLKDQNANSFREHENQTDNLKKNTKNNSLRIKKSAITKPQHNYMRSAPEFDKKKFEISTEMITLKTKQFI